MNFWQIGTGDGKVNMVDIFIKLNIALLGPGDYGNYFNNKTVYQNLPDGHLVKKIC